VNKELFVSIMEHISPDKVLTLSKAISQLIGERGASLLTAFTAMMTLIISVAKGVIWKTKRL
jgi:hypothetical protein